MQKVCLTMLVHYRMWRMEIPILNLVILHCLFITVCITRAVSSETGKLLLRSSETCDWWLIENIILFSLISFVNQFNFNGFLIKKQFARREQQAKIRRRMRISREPSTGNRPEKCAGLLSGKETQVSILWTLNSVYRTQNLSQK